MRTGKIYDEQIAHLVTKILEICLDNKIPCLLDFRLEEDEGEYVGCTSVIPFGIQADEDKYLILREIIMKDAVLNDCMVKDEKSGVYYDNEIPGMENLIEKATKR
jgi:hypothetical protein